jgi:hypothetical protein
MSAKQAAERESKAHSERSHERGPHLDIEEEHEHEREDGNALIVVRPRDATGDVAGHDAHKGGGRQARARALDLRI